MKTYGQTPNPPASRLATLLEVQNLQAIHRVDQLQALLQARHRLHVTNEAKHL